jgi:hypothetical protein
MRQLSSKMLDAIAGSVPDARLVVYPWYDGKLATKDPLPLANWSIQWAGSDQNLIQGKASFTVNDPTGELAPWGFDEPLSAAGSKLQASFVCGTESVDLGWYAVSSNAPTEQWRTSGPLAQWVAAGASIPVTADDLTLLISDAKFIAPESPPAGATVISEVRRLLKGICPVTVAPGVVDGPVPASVVYKDDRLAPVFDLVKSLGCRYRMDGAGQLEIYPLVKTAPVWTIQGKDGGAMVSVNRTQNRADVINGVLSTSNDPSLEIRRLATLTTGPLRWDGPLGRKVNYHTALANTADGVQKDADAILENSTVTRTVPLTVICTPHPGIQIGDWVRVAQPVINGAEYPLDGLVSAVGLKGSAAGVEAMSLTVECSLTDVQAVGSYVRRNR